MDTTTNLGLKKPGYSDPSDIGDINDNMDIIDGAIGDINNSKGAANGIAELDENGKVPTDQLPHMVDVEQISGNKYRIVL